MSIQSWSQRGEIRFHFVESSEKKKSNRQKIIADFGKKTEILRRITLPFVYRRWESVCKALGVRPYQWNKKWRRCKGKKWWKSKEGGRNRFGRKLCMRVKKGPNILNPAFGKRTDNLLGNVPLFLEHWFSCKQNRQPYFKFHIGKGELYIYWLMLWMLEFLGYLAVLVGTPISRCFRTLSIDNKRIQHAVGSLLI